MSLDGSTGTFSSPASLWRPDGAEVQATDADPLDGRSGPFILVVDDTQLIRNVVTGTLEFEGYKVVQATNGAEALDIITRRLPVLVLLDMRMPILNGWELARLLHERGIQVPIVVMTAAADAQIWAARIGAAGYLAKPFGSRQLLDKVLEFVDPRSMH